MAKKAFSLEAGAPPRVELEWKFSWKDMRVRVDGAELGVIADQKALKAGRDFPLPDGHTLRVQLAQSLASVDLCVTRDGIPLPGSGSDPAERVKQAAQMLYFIAALNVILGVLAGALGVQFLSNIGIGWGNVVEGLLYAGFAFGTSKRSAIALGLGIALFAVDTLFLLASFGNGSPPIGGIVARVFFFIPLVKGMTGMTALKKGVPARA
jgi:hypothetical protein